MPPRKARERLRNPRIHEVSLVPEGDNPPASIDLSKADDSKVVNGKTFPRSAFALNTGSPSGWKLLLFDTPEDASANRPSIRLTAAAAQALGPNGFRGQRVQIPAGERSRVVGRVRSAWLRARQQADQDVSREDLPAVLKGRFTGLVQKVLSLLSEGKSDSEIEKRLFDEVRADGTNEQVCDVLMSRIGDLAQSVREILYGYTPEGEPEPDRQALIAETVSQFAGSIDRDVADVFAGRIMKALGGQSDLGEAEFAKALGEVFATPRPDNGSDRREGQGMDLTKLNDADRKAVEEAIAKGARVAELEAEVAKLKAAAEPEPKGDPVRKAIDAVPDPELRKALDDKFVKQQAELDAQRESNAALAKEVEQIKKERQREAFAKSVGDLSGLAEGRDELIEKLWAVQDAGARDTMQKTLEAAAEAARRGGLTEVGASDGRGAGGSTAYGKIVAAADELRKARPELTREQARDAVMKERPELYHEYLAEAN